jgi:hypothetical protein
MKHDHAHLSAPFDATLSQALIPFMAGLVFGGALLVYLRHRRLHWTWALATIPFAGAPGSAWFSALRASPTCARSGPAKTP